MKDTSDWCFRSEFIKYCEDDVLLLAKAVLAFRKIIKEKLDIDPFKYITLARLSMDSFINKFLPERTIVGCSNRKQSIESIEWLNYLNNKNIIPEVPVTVQNKYALKANVTRKISIRFAVMVLIERIKAYQSFTVVFIMVVRCALLIENAQMKRLWSARSYL